MTPELERIVARIIDPLAMSDSIDPDVLAERLEIRRKSVQILDAIYQHCREPTPEMLNKAWIVKDDSEDVIPVHRIAEIWSDLLAASPLEANRRPGIGGWPITGE